MTSGAEFAAGTYGRGLKDCAAGVKKERSGVAVRRRLIGLDIALAEEVPAKEREEVRMGRESDIRRITCQTAD